MAARDCDSLPFTIDAVESDSAWGARVTVAPCTTNTHHFRCGTTKGVRLPKNLTKLRLTSTEILQEKISIVFELRILISKCYEKFVRGHCQGQRLRLMGWNLAVKRREALFDLHGVVQEREREREKECGSDEDSNEEC